MIDLPEAFRRKSRNMVVLDDSVDTTTDKIALMKKAATDPLFIADVEAVTYNFRVPRAEISLDFCPQI